MERQIPNSEGEDANTCLCEFFCFSHGWLGATKHSRAQQTTTSCSTHTNDSNKATHARAHTHTHTRARAHTRTSLDLCVMTGTGSASGRSAVCTVTHCQALPREGVSGRPPFDNGAVECLFARKRTTTTPRDSWAQRPSLRSLICLPLHPLFHCLCTAICWRGFPRSMPLLLPP